MKYGKKVNRPVFLFTVLIVTLTTAIAAEDYNLDSVTNISSHTVFAHISNEYGNITVVTGWDQEPPLIDELNDIVVGVTRNSGDSEDSTAIPIRNALAEMDIEIKYGGVTKSLDFVPSEEEAGWYVADILPTRPGSYGLTLNGTIDGQSIGDEIQIEDVVSKQGISFPEVSSGGVSGGSSGTASANLVSGQISNILNQITNDINNIRDDIGTLGESNSNIEEGIQNVRGIADRSYMLAVTAMGVGAAGILIGAAALVRTR